MNVPTRTVVVGAVVMGVSGPAVAQEDLRPSGWPDAEQAVEEYFSDSRRQVPMYAHAHCGADSVWHDRVQRGLFERASLRPDQVVGLAHLASILARKCGSDAALRWVERHWVDAPDLPTAHAMGAVLGVLEPRTLDLFVSIMGEGGHHMPERSFVAGFYSAAQLTDEERGDVFFGLLAQPVQPEFLQVEGYQLLTGSSAAGFGERAARWIRETDAGEVERSWFSEALVRSAEYAGRDLHMPVATAELIREALLAKGDSGQLRALAARLRRDPGG